MHRLLSIVTASTLVAAVTIGLPVTAQAAGHHLSAHLGDETVLVKSPAVVTGALSPAAARRTVSIQQLVDHGWRTVGHAQTGDTGAFAASIKAPGRATTWRLRASTVIAGKVVVSPPLVERVVPTAFALAAAVATPVTAGGPISVAGAVLPKASGPVRLQALVAGTWRTLSTGRLSTGGTFHLTASEPPGGYQLRVIRPSTSTVAAGHTATLIVTVPPVVTTSMSPTPAAAAAPAAPTITTNVLETAIVGLPYSQTLAATGGTGPYAWSARGLPTGLTLSPAGTISGTPVAPATVTVTVTVADAAGQTASLPLYLAAALSPSAGNVVRSWGSNNNGQLGDGGTADSDLSVAVGTLTGVTAVAGGPAAGYALRFDGTVWGWGDDQFGELGSGAAPAGAVTSPVQVQGLPPVVSIAAGGNSASDKVAMALTQSGTVWAWGDSLGGELGNGSTAGSDLPVQVTNLSDVTGIAVGAAGQVAVTAQGTVWTWGGSVAAALPTQVQGLPGPAVGVAAGAGATFALLKDGTVWAWGTAGADLGDGTSTASATPVQVINLPACTAIVASDNSAYALGADGSVWAWGGNQHGQLGNGTTSASNQPIAVAGLSGIVQIAAGSVGGSTAVDAAALRPDGTMRIWGANGAGEAGNGTTGTDATTPVQPTALPTVRSLGVGGGAVYAVVSP